MRRSRRNHNVGEGRMTVAFTSGQEEGRLTRHYCVDVVVVQAADVIAHGKGERCLLVTKAVNIRHRDGTGQQILRELEEVHADVRIEANGSQDRMLAGREAVREERGIRSWQLEQVEGEDGLLHE